ncbi:uncharacterized protein K452DRAFT_239884 [Aplosporella prunicola CBS 121167]|uniref:PD-(D/E)XK nuclease-like domain-containing protein n=1 Tax=Aplosporella prunicola CBS 121167 TaxID=1176127 RepID=A0A6A6AT52_9PEZI|nr:uncharacterized protein K452DRAFT_239884 [Aplosporella prunicola CBS 121167]KAF2135139.1 hypothetical protein K452DRAFT_239884 [Aplosporella prunicola CBS 121167]
MVGEGFELKDLATHKGDLDATAREVLAELELIADGEEYVPRAIKDEFEAATEILPLRPYNLADTALSKQHLLAELDEAVEIQQESTRCSLDSVAEPDWNESVHCRILRLALKRNKAVQFRNITRAQIQPPTLIPRLLCGLSIESKMVDYALILPSTDTHISTGIEKLLKAQPVEHQSINQTRYQSVRFQPIALNIETKASNRTESEALVQLTVWTAAGFQQLQVLTASRRPRFIPVPLLMVNGSVWWLLWATWDEADKMTLYSKVQIGDTRELKGIYKLLASMRRLIGWVERVWRPWFTREVLGV